MMVKMVWRQVVGVARSWPVRYDPEDGNIKGMGRHLGLCLNPRGNVVCYGKQCLFHLQDIFFNDGTIDSELLLHIFITVILVE